MAALIQIGPKCESLCYWLCPHESLWIADAFLLTWPITKGFHVDTTNSRGFHTVTTNRKSFHTNTTNSKGAATNTKGKLSHQISPTLLLALYVLLIAYHPYLRPSHPMNFHQISDFYQD